MTSSLGAPPQVAVDDLGSPEAFLEAIDKTIKYLREKYWYCFWCKYRYEDEGMEDCPGLTEDEHG